MRKLKLKGIVAVTALSIVLTGCGAKEETQINSNDYNSSTVYEEQTQENNYYVPNITIPDTTVDKETTYPPYTEPSNEETITVPEQNEENFNYFKEAKQEIISYIESEEFEELKAKGKYYVTTGIDFIFFDEPINGVYFDDLTDSAKKEIIRDIGLLDQAIMEYHPDYKETFSEKYHIAAGFISEKYLDVMEAIKNYLGEENYNAVGEIKDQITGDIKDKTGEIVDDLKELYKGWRNN